MMLFGAQLILESSKYCYILQPGLSSQSSSVAKPVAAAKKNTPEKPSDESRSQSSPAAASEDEGSGGENEESGGEDKELSLEQLQAQKAARARYMRFYRSLRSKRAMSAHMQMWGVKDLHN